MPTYLYCLLSEAADPPQGLTGIGAARVRSLAIPATRESRLVAWVSDARRDQVARGEEGARQHDAVCEAALATGSTPLPARFGQLFDSDEACVAQLALKETQLRAALARIAGTVEMAVTALLPVRGPLRVSGAGATSGREYLKRIRDVQQRTEEVSAVSDDVRSRVAEAVGGLARAEVVRLSLTQRPHIAISHLVDRAAERAYRRALAPLGATFESGALAVMGPSAPYTFATLDAEAG